MAHLTQIFSFALVGFALILIIEGSVYALFPNKMKALLNRMVAVPAADLRSGGLVAAAGGLGLIWAVKLF